MSITLNLTASGVIVSSGNFREVSVEVEEVDESEVLDHFQIEDIVQHFSEDELLEHIGLDAAKNYWGLRDEDN